MWLKKLDDLNNLKGEVIAGTFYEKRIAENKSKRVYTRKSNQEKGDKLTV